MGEAWEGDVAEAVDEAEVAAAFLVLCIKREAAAEAETKDISSASTAISSDIMHLNVGVRSEMRR